MNNELNIIFVGDICLGWNIGDLIVEQGKEYILQNVKHILKRADIRVGNLEFCIVNPQSTKAIKSQIMAVPPKIADLINRDEFNVFNMANNHILDCGYKNLEFTCRFLDKKGIVHFGAGSNLDEAAKGILLDWGDKTIAFFGFGDTSRYYAGKSKPGIAPMSRKLIRKNIAGVIGKADLIVVNIHSDLEFSDYPSIWRTDLARWIIDEGAH
ncbi:MAG: CapA family protein, partial [Candidatus Helarchaeota archaeon]